MKYYFQCYVPLNKLYVTNRDLKSSKHVQESKKNGMSIQYSISPDAPKASIKLEATDDSNSFSNSNSIEKVNDIKIDITFNDDCQKPVFLKNERNVPIIETIKIEQEVLQCPVNDIINECQSNCLETSLLVKQESKSKKPKEQISRRKIKVRKVTANRNIREKNKQRKIIAKNRNILSKGTPETLECHKCKYTCMNKVTYETHIKLHNAEKIFKCDQCTYFAITKDMIDKHNSVHNSNASFKCDLCNFFTNRKNTIRRHIRSHNDIKKYKCEKCNFASKWKFNLKDHMLAKHNPLKPFKCESCGRTFLKENLLKSHLIEHTGFQCESCHKKFKTKSLLRSHQRRHSDRHLWAFKCDICNTNFLNKSTLNAHKLKHSGEPHKCTECDYKTVYKSTLKRHLLKHGIVIPSGRDKNPMIECQFCVYKCRRKQHLDNHMLKHTGEVPFQCDVCSRGFNTVYHLQRHSKLHSRKVTIVENSDSLSFKCDLCDTGYSSVFSLMRHSVIHRQEKIVGL